MKKSSVKTLKGTIKVYRYMRCKQKRRKRIGPLKNDLGEFITEEKEMANMLNTYFGSVLTEEDIKKHT